MSRTFFPCKEHFVQFKSSMDVKGSIDANREPYL